MENRIALPLSPTSLLSPVSLLPITTALPLK
jgi:hypothetical protein